MTTGELLRRLRAGNNWTQAELGERLGVGRAQVSNVEAGKSDMPAGPLLALLDALGGLTATTPGWLPNRELPEGAIPAAALLIVNYIGPDGSNQRLVSTKGDAPATTYLGMTVKAQADINGWDEES